MGALQNGVSIREKVRVSTCTGRESGRPVRRATVLLAVVMALSSLPFVQLSPAGAQTLTPTLFEKAGYLGTKISVAQSEPNLPGKYGTSFTPSSGTGVTGLKAAMYDKVNYQGVCMELGEKLHEFSSTLLADNATKSVKLGETCGGEAVLFGNPRYNSGSTTCVGFLCPLNKAGPRHALPVPGGAATPTALPDVASVLTKLQSIALPYGGSAAAYSEPGFGGVCKTIRKPVDDLVSAGIDIKSLQLGRTCDKAVHLFTGPAENGDMVKTTGDVPDVLGLKVKDKLVDWSLTNTRPDSFVSVFTDRYFKGTCKEVKGEDASQPFGVAHNLTVGSVRAGKCADGTGVHLYPSKSFEGKGSALAGDQPDLGDTGKNAASLVNGTDDPYAAFEGAGYTGSCRNIAPRSADDDLKGKLIHNVVGSMKRGACPPVATLHYHDAAGGRVQVQITGNVTDLAAAGVNDAAFAISNLSDTTLSLYREAEFKGACQNVPANTIVASLEGSVVGYHDLSSIKVGPCPTHVQLFGQPGFAGARRALGADLPDLSAQGFDDLTSSVVNNTGVVVALYSQTDYHARCQQLDPGESVNDLVNSPVGNDTTSSVRVGEKCRAIALLFDGADFGGTFLGLGEDAADLGRLRLQPSGLVDRQQHGSDDLGLWDGQLQGTVPERSAGHRHPDAGRQHRPRRCHPVHEGVRTLPASPGHVQKGSLQQHVPGQGADHRRPAGQQLRRRDRLRGQQHGRTGGDLLQPQLPGRLPDARSRPSSRRPRRRREPRGWTALVVPLQFDMLRPGLHPRLMVVGRQGTSSDRISRAGRRPPRP